MGAPEEALNEKAVTVISRIKDKLTGRDFLPESKVLTVPSQVQRLIEQATSHENLCQCYIGWCVYPSPPPPPPPPPSLSFVYSTVLSPCPVRQVSVLVRKVMMMS